MRVEDIAAKAQVCLDMVLSASEQVYIEIHMLSESESKFSDIDSTEYRRSSGLVNNLAKIKVHSVQINYIIIQLFSK